MPLLGDGPASRVELRLRGLRVVAVAMVLLAAFLVLTQSPDAWVARADRSGPVLLILALEAIALIALPARLPGLRRLVSLLGSPPEVSPTRRGFLVGVVALWFVGTGGVSLLPGELEPATLVLAEPSLEPWVREVIDRDAALRTLAWRFVSSDQVADGCGAEIWLGTSGQPGAADVCQTTLARETSIVASSPYVVVAWERSLEPLSLRAERPVDLAAIQTAVASPNGPSFVIPLGTTRLGADALLLLALAHQGPAATSLTADPAQDEELQDWLRPFFQRQPRAPREVESIQFDDWVRYRATVGDAGLLPEHVALKTAEVVQAQAPLHIRYPIVSRSREYALTVVGVASPLYQRLAEALRSDQAQLALGRYGLRPIHPLSPPESGPFVSLRANGADWGARWDEAQWSERLEAWAREWRP